MAITSEDVEASFLTFKVSPVTFTVAAFDTFEIINTAKNIATINITFFSVFIKEIAPYLF